MSEEDDDIEAILHAESEAMSLAETHMMRYTPFSMLPDTVTIRYIDDFKQILVHKGISKSEAALMARSDLSKIADGLRGSTASMPWLGSVRFAALIHVAMRIGVKATLDIPMLWECLRNRDFEGASDALVMSTWPRMVGNEEDEKRRAMDIIRMMRRGVLTTSFSSATH